MAEVVINEELVEVHVDANSSNEVITLLSQKLAENGWVRAGFLEHVLNREEVFPTGLPTCIPVALCHTDAEFVKKSSLAVATLTRPIKFREMGNPDSWLDVEIVFLLALDDPKDQCTWLRKMTCFFQNQSQLLEIKQSPTCRDLSNKLREYLT